MKENASVWDVGELHIIGTWSICISTPTPGIAVLGVQIQVISLRFEKRFCMEWLHAKMMIFSAADKWVIMFEQAITHIQEDNIISSHISKLTIAQELENIVVCHIPPPNHFPPKLPTVLENEEWFFFPWTPVAQGPDPPQNNFIWLLVVLPNFKVWLKSCSVLSIRKRT